MPADLLGSTFDGTVPWVRIAGGCAAMAVGGILGAALAFRPVRRRVVPKPRETRLPDVLPFERVLGDGATLVCRDGTYVAAIEVEGADTLLQPPQVRAAHIESRKRWIDVLADTGVEARVFFQRDPALLQGGYEFPGEVLQRIADLWEGAYRDAFVNRQVIVLSVDKGAEPAQRRRPDDGVDVTLEVLQDYHPRLLIQAGESPSDGLLAFWGGLSAPLSRPTPTGTGAGVSEAISGDTVKFARSGGAVLFHEGTDPETGGPLNTLHAAILGIRATDDWVDEAMIAELTAVPCRMTVCHLIRPKGKVAAKARLEYDRRLTLSARPTETAVSQFEAASRMVDGDDEFAQAWCTYSMVIVLYHEDAQALEEAVNAVRAICRDHGTTVAREGVAAQEAWYMMWPGYRAVWLREHKFFSKAVAALVTLERPSPGLTGSDWGEGPVARFPTPAGTTYNFCFQVSGERRAVGHGVVIGPAGGGKTTLMAFLNGMAMRIPAFRSFMIDRHFGLEVFTAAIGGHYIRFGNNAGDVGLNPLQMNDTPENREFAKTWLQSISGLHDPDSAEEMNFLVDTAFDALGRDERSLANAYGALDPKGETAVALRKWVEPAMMGELFNAPRDTLDVISNRWTVFDFTTLYEDPEKARAVLTYILHRIERVLEETGSIGTIFIDETEPVLANEIAVRAFLKFLQEYRKRGIACISAFQRPQAVDNCGAAVASAIRTQCQTRYFLQNRSAAPEEYEGWNLNDRDVAFIGQQLKVCRRHPRSVLIKRGSGESVIVDVDLSALGRWIKLFYADKAARDLARELADAHGAAWPEIYMEQI